MDGLIQLEVKNNPSGKIISLDGMKLHHVKDYEIKSPGLPKGTAELSITLLVKYP